MGKVIATYGGGFKPPTKGHFEVVKKALEQNPDIDEFIIYVGAKERDGIDQTQSILIWEIYQNYLPMKVEIKPSKSPIKDVLGVGKNNPEDKVYFILGSREGNEQDQIDIQKRTKGIKIKYPNIEVKTISTPDNSISGTKARRAINVSMEDFAKFLPDVLDKEEIEEIYELLRPSGKISKLDAVVETHINELTDKEIKFWALHSDLFTTLSKSIKKYKALAAKLKGERRQALDYFYNNYFEDGKPVLTEKVLPKNKWIDLNTSSEQNKFSDELISLVQKAYKNTPEGSFVNTKSDVVKSNWKSIDFDEEPDIDATIFYREPRAQETWKGKKIQGIGHDGSREAINLILKKLSNLLNQKGVWVEASDALEHILYKMGVPYIEDEDLIEKIFPGTDVKMVGEKGKYTRKISSKNITETIFGKPVLKSKLLKENATYSQHIDYKQKIAELTDYMREKGHKIDPLPTVEFINGDSENAKDFFGKTAYYDPENQVIALYTEGRHPKDIVRSFAHEMIHHIQNLENRLEGISTTNTTEDSNLEDIEKEAYLNGNISFRSWTDSLQENISNNTYPFEVTDKSYDETDNSLITVEYEFDTPDNTYRVEFYSGEYSPEAKTFAASFGVSTGEFNALDTYQMTGEGNARKIFKTIINIIKDFINKEDVNKIIIDGTSEKRKRIYKNIFSNISPKIEIVELDIPINITSLHEYITPADKSKVDPKELKMGIKVEMEHTNDPKEAEVIALQHLAEDPKYYTKLATLNLEEKKKDLFGLNAFALELAKEINEELKKVNEVGEGSSKTYKFDLLSSDDFEVKYEFYTDSGIHYQVEFESLFDKMDKANSLIVGFRVVGGDYDEVTNKGELFSVMGTVIKITKKFQKEHPHITKYAFVPVKSKGMDDVRRKKLYLKYIEKNFPNWEVSTTDPEYDTGDYIVVKKPNIEEEQQLPQYEIYSDMDGVITDFEERFKSISDGIPPNKYEEEHGKEKLWGLVDKHGVGWWVGMPWMPDGEKYWNYIKKYKPVVLSAPSRSDTSRLGKRLWVRNNLPGTKIILAYSADKKNYAKKNAILIDDRKSNIDDWIQAGGIGILHTSAESTIKQLKELGL